MVHVVLFGVCVGGAAMAGECNKQYCRWGSSYLDRMGGQFVGFSRKNGTGVAGRVWKHVKLIC